MRILIVEDDDLVRDLYARCLNQPGFDFACFRSGPATVEAASHALSDDAPFAVAFVDTDGAGWDTARRLRALDPDLNLVIVTANSDIAADTIGGDVDKLFHIAKPFAAAEIVQMATALRARWASDRHLITARAQLRAQVLLLEERRRDLAVAEAHAVHSATHDSLTEAPNRLAFLRALEARMRRPGSFAVGMVDLDRFKMVNDTLGHLAGDALIRAMCAILQAEAPSGTLVARLGGDEFGLLFDTSGDRAAVAACTRIVTACAVPIPVIGTTVQSGASAGVMVAEGGCGEAIDLVRRADLALNEAKRRGRGGVQLFNESMDEDLRYRQRIESELALALERGELALVFQPIVGRDDLCVEGFEALLRWNHPERGSLAPAGFLAVAEQSNLIHALGDWALGEALAQAARWQRSYVAVNVSPRQFRRHDFARHVAGHLARAGVLPSRLQIEISERALADDPDRAATTLRQLRALGCRVLLDDFGAGPCNIGELRRLAIDSVKIDRSYVHAIGREEGGAGLLQALVHLARGLRLEVVAKGVETVAQLQVLRIAGASQVQGFVVAPPMSPDAAWAMAGPGSVDLPRTVGHG